MSVNSRQSRETWEAREGAAMDIRRLKEADGEAYRQLRATALQEAPEAFAATYAETAGRDTDYYAQRLRAQEDDLHILTLGAFDQEELIGVVTLLRQRGMKTRHKATMVAMYVAREMRGRGVGRMLVEAVIAHAREMPGLEQVQTTVVTTNTAARRLYHRVGFEAYGIERRALKHAERAWDEELLVHELAHR